MDASLSQVGAAGPGKSVRTITPAAVAVVQSIRSTTSVPGVDWAQVAEFVARRHRVAVDGRALALLIERLICHGELE